jgi:asparagine synthase (glutamine-hydrolysing)
MIADVRVGVFLSGGYDSSIVSAILANHKLDTFTIGFAKERYNEATYAREIAKYLHTNHHEHILNAKEALDIVSSIAYVYDEPFADSSAVATIAVSRLAKKDVKVAISADGADELFAGYNTYDVVLKYAKLKYFRSFIALLKIFKPFISNFDTRYDKLKYISHATSHATILKYLVHIFSLEDVHRLLPTFRIMPVAFDTDVSSLDSLSQLLSLDFKMYLMDDILTKVDRASMSVSLEAREVFLDYNIVQFVAQLPSSFKYGPTKKYILKELAYQYIPKELLHREKMGFGIPLEEWLRGEMKDLVYSYLNPHTLKQQNILLTDEVLRVRDDFYNHKHNNARKIWNLLMFGMFYEKWCKN